MTRPWRTIVRIATSLIPAKRLRKRCRGLWLAAEQARYVARKVPEVRARYRRHLAALREKLVRGEKLRVCFIVCDASMFSAESVFQAMCKDARFEPFIAVVPRVSRGSEFLRETFDKTLSTLAARYGDAVVQAYDVRTGVLVSASFEADLVFSSVLYENQTCAGLTTEKLSEKSLVAIVYYGYGGLFKTNETRTPLLPNVVFAWRYYVSNEATRAMSVARNPLLADNIEVAGYCKMDRLARFDAGCANKGGRKTVLICPHHSIDPETDGLALSTFLRNAGVLLALPEKFPEIDFVFRPHPLLFVRLTTSKWWGREKTAEYCRRMAAHPNVEFQRGGDYFETFARSDGLIHDCGSFLAEYFYTGKPQCYLMESAGTIEKQFLPFSRRLVEHVDLAFRESDIHDFIRRRVLAADDPGGERRRLFAVREVCVNHPDATGHIVASCLAGIEKGVA